MGSIARRILDIYQNEISCFLYISETALGNQEIWSFPPDVCFTKSNDAPNTPELCSFACQSRMPLQPLIIFTIISYRIASGIKAFPAARPFIHHPSSKPLHLLIVYLASNCTILLFSLVLPVMHIPDTSSYLFVRSLYKTRCPHSLHRIGSPLLRGTLELQSPQI